MDVVRLQRRLIYCCVVAGKNARFAQHVVSELFDGVGIASQMKPFSYLKMWRDLGILGEILREVKTGNYTKLERCFSELLDADLDLETCTVEQLEQIHGIGPKTARFFILWNRPEENLAILDVHVLRWLRNLGWEAPETTPASSSTYRAWEQVFLDQTEIWGMSAYELDHLIWSNATKNARYQEML